jgi:hypothetical protein
MVKKTANVAGSDSEIRANIQCPQQYSRARVRTKPNVGPITQRFAPDTKDQGLTEGTA